MPTPKSVELDRGIEARNSATKSCSRLGDFAINKRSTISELFSFKLNSPLTTLHLSDNPVRDEAAADKEKSSLGLEEKSISSQNLY